MALSAIPSAASTLTLTWTVQKARPGFSPTENNQTLTERIRWGLGTGLEAFNELVATVVTVAMGATLDVDLSAALTNVVNDANVPLARVKLLCIKLLSVADVDQAGAAL